MGESKLSIHQTQEVACDRKLLGQTWLQTFNSNLDLSMIFIVIILLACFNTFDLFEYFRLVLILYRFVLIFSTCFNTFDLF